MWQHEKLSDALSLGPSAIQLGVRRAGKGKIPRAKNREGKKAKKKQRMDRHCKTIVTESKEMGVMGGDKREKDEVINRERVRKTKR